MPWPLEDDRPRPLPWPPLGRGAGDGRPRLGGRSLRGEPLLLLLLPLPACPGDALRVDEQGDDQREAADQAAPSAGQAEPLVEGARGPPSHRRRR